jgi:hypothetical protein
MLLVQLPRRRKVGYYLSSSTGTALPRDVRRLPLVLKAKPDDHQCRVSLDRCLTEDWMNFAQQAALKRQEQRGMVSNVDHAA